LKANEIQRTGINDYLDLRGKDKVMKAEIATICLTGVLQRVRGA
jgi:hypothetical protein